MSPAKVKRPPPVLEPPPPADEYDLADFKLSSETLTGSDNALTVRRCLLRANLEAAANGPIVVNFPTMYRCESTVYVTLKDLTLRGVGDVGEPGEGGGIYATTIGPTGDPEIERTRSHLRLIDCENVTLDRLEIQGANASWVYNVDLEGQAAMWIEGGDGLTFVDVHAHHTYGDYLYLSGYLIPDVGASPAKNVNLLRGYAHDIGRIVVTFTMTENVHLDGLLSGRNKRSFMDMEPPSRRYNTIVDTTIENFIWEASDDRSLFLRINQVARVRNLNILNNVREKAPIGVWATAEMLTAAETATWGNARSLVDITIDGNEWDQEQPGGRLYWVLTTDGTTITNNVGPYRAASGAPIQYTYNGIDRNVNSTFSPNTFTPT